MAKKKSFPKTQDIDIVMIGKDAYYAVYPLKKAQVFALSLKNIQYQAEKKVSAETNPKSIIPKEYYDFLDVFSKKDLDNLLLY